MAQCNNFANFSINEAGLQRFGSHGGLTSTSRVSSGLPARLVVCASPNSTIYDMERSFASILWNRSISEHSISLSKNTCWSLKFPFATHGRKEIASLAENPRSSSLTIQEMDASRERERLKEELCSALESTGGHLNDEGNAIISLLQKLNPYPDITTCGKELYTGFFEGVVASFKGTGKKGEGQKEVGASGTVVTLGRAAFNSFKPQGLEIRLNQTYNHVGHGSDDAYSVIIVFSVEDNSTSSLSPLEGLLINKARFSISNPERMEVVFLSSTLAPRYPETDIDRWFKVFKIHNPDMDEAGAVTLTLPPIKGWLDYLYLDEDIRIAKGNRGGISVVRRLDKPVVAGSQSQKPLQKA